MIKMKHPDVSEVQRNVAFRIRAELVCCGIYDWMQKEMARLKKRGCLNPFETAQQNAIGSHRWHDLCYWGEAAAGIAEGRCPGYETMPNICQCGCCGCQHNCGAHQEGSDAAS